MRKEKPMKVKKERLVSVNIDMRFILKIILIFFLCLFIWYILNYKHLIIYLVDNSEKNEYESYMYSILVSLMLMLFLVACGFFVKVSKAKWKLVLIFCILYILYLGFTFVSLGFRFRTNFGLLNNDTYESSTSKGIEFFLLNFAPFWFFVYIISFIFESEKE